MIYDIFFIIIRNVILVDLFIITVVSTIHNVLLYKIKINLQLYNIYF